MHRLQLTRPVFITKGLKNCWEIIGTVEGGVVVDGLDGGFGVLSHGKKVVHKYLIRLHFLERKHKWSKMLESSHLNPFIGILAKFVKKHNELIIFGLIT